MDITQIFQSFKNEWLTVPASKVADPQLAGELPPAQWYQCVSLVKKYLSEKLGLSPGYWGDAIDFWNHTSGALLSVLDKIPGGDNIEIGDIVVLTPNHIGLATGNFGNGSFELLEQNGQTGGGTGTGGDAIRTRYIPRSRVAGVLRPKNAVIVSTPPPAPVPAAGNAHVGQVLVMPASVAQWHFYNPAGPFDLPHAAGALAPGKFGGLKYNVLANPMPNFYRIGTQMFGEVVVYAGNDTDVQWENPAPAAPRHPYTIEDLSAPKKMVADVDRTEWNLDDTEWGQFVNNPAGSLAANQPITVVAIAHHDLGSNYYMEDRNAAKGYNVQDLHDYTEPAPAPAPTPNPSTAEIIYERLASPVVYTAKLQPTNVWGFNHSDWPGIEADVKRQLNADDRFTATGRAKHSLGGVYMMTAAAFGDADTTGTPAAYEGINVADLNGTPTPPAPVSQPAGPTEPPKPTPEPVSSPGVTIPVTTALPGSTITPTPVSPAVDWRNSFKASVRPLIAAETIIVKDLEGFLPDIKLEAGKLIPKAGDIWKDGKAYILTIPSHAKGHYYGIPNHIGVPPAKSQMKQAELIVENLWDKYHHDIEDELDELFHDGMHFIDDIAQTAQTATKLHGRDRWVDVAARVLFHKNKK